jgi:hypothetical protein
MSSTPTTTATTPSAAATAASAIPPFDDTAAVLFAACEAAWDDHLRHDKFVKYCSSAGLLAAAARAYRRHLDRHPDDLVATRMQQRIVTMASLLLATQKPARKPVTRSRGFAVLVGLAALAGALAAVLYG